MWLAERIAEQAENELYDEDAIRTALVELEAAREAGDLEEDEIAEAEDALIERLMLLRDIHPEGSDGTN